MQYCEPCLCDLPVTVSLRPSEIFDKCCTFFDMAPEIFKKKERQNREITDCLHMSITMVHENSRLSLKAVGEIFGGKDHSSIINAKNNVKKLSDTDNDYKNTYNRLSQFIFNCP